jgi:hypothetical protein
MKFTMTSAHPEGIPSTQREEEELQRFIHTYCREEMGHPDVQIVRVVHDYGSRQVLVVIRKDVSQETCHCEDYPCPHVTGSLCWAMLIQMRSGTPRFEVLEDSLDVED